MADPETARQAAEEALEDWADAKRGGDCSVTDAGDALAVLVPQLLDQQKETHETHLRMLGDEQRWRAECERQYQECVAEKAQLLDQLAASEHNLACLKDQWNDPTNFTEEDLVRENLALGERCRQAEAEVERGFKTNKAERKKLGERVRQLETALEDAIECVHDWAAYASDYFKEKWDLEGDLARLRAALGDTPPPPDDRFRHAFVPGVAQPALCAKCLSSESSSVHVAVEPPQPETPITERDK